LENNLSQIDLGVFCFNQEDLLAFIFDRLRVKLRTEGKRFDVLDAVFSVSADGNLVRLMRRVTALTEFLQTSDGANLLIAYRRAANILRIEDAVDGPHRSHPVHGPLPTHEEENLRDMLALIQQDTVQDFLDGNFERAMAALSKLRTLVDTFFENVTVNAPEPELRRNRLQLLARLRDLMHQIADFSKIEG
jgi:glycyl-tRNA synthetase beta chain